MAGHAEHQKNEIAMPVNRQKNRLAEFLHRLRAAVAWSNARPYATMPMRPERGLSSHVDELSVADARGEFQADTSRKQSAPDEGVFYWRAKFSASRRLRISDSGISGV